MLTEPAWRYTQRTGDDFADLLDVPSKGNDISCSGAIPNSSASTVISIVVNLGKQGTVSPLRNKPLRKKVTLGQNEQNVCVPQNLYTCQKPYNIKCERKNSRTFQPVVFSPYIILQMR